MDRSLVEELYAEKTAVRDILKEYESDWDIVDDLMQDVYAEALESPFDGKSEALTWLCAIAKNVGKMHVRGTQADKRSNEVLEVYVETQADSTPEPYYDRSDLSADVAAQQAALDPALIIEAEDSYASAMEAMPPRMAMAVAMRRDGIPNPEIARELGCSEKTVRNLISESRKYFRDNQRFNATNSVQARDSERDGATTRVVRHATQASVERAVQERFERRDSAFEKRRIRLEHPDATAKEWKEMYHAAD